MGDRIGPEHARAVATRAMDPFEIFATIVGSRLFMAVAALALVGASGHAVLQSVRSRRRLLAFMQTHGFRWTETGSTMWLARVIERFEMLDMCGHYDGRWVDVRSRGRYGRCITVTADRELVSGQNARVISLGAWTHPRPPAPLAGMHLDACGRELRVFLGGGNFVPYIVAAVAYAKMLEEQPVDPDAGRV
jgi:hypothetical protein